MKNVIHLMAVIFATTGSAKAQQPSGGDVQNGEARVRTEISFTPVLHIQLASGTDREGRDLVSLKLNRVSDYETGVKELVKNQLGVFAIGTRYAVLAEVSAAKGQEGILNVFALDVDIVNAPAGRLRPKKMSLSKKTLVHSTNAKGYEVMDAVYAIDPMDTRNHKAFRDLLGKNGKPLEYNIYVTYTIVAL